MKNRTNELEGIELTISFSADGELQVAYIRLKPDKVNRTDEVIEDVLLADYNRKGELVGIEILSPVKVSLVAKLVDKPHRTSFRRFVKKHAPQELVLA